MNWPLGIGFEDDSLVPLILFAFCLPHGMTSYLMLLFPHTGTDPTMSPPWLASHPLNCEPKQTYLPQVASVRDCIT